MEPTEISLKQKLHSETALIAWHELQRFFAKGVVLLVDDTLDLIDIAVMFAEDNVELLQDHTNSGAVASPTNEQARSWFDNNTELWSVVVAPYVLVQDRQSSD